jgi:hypothetical protein
MIVALATVVIPRAAKNRRTLAANRRPGATDLTRS